MTRSVHAVTCTLSDTFFACPSCANTTMTAKALRANLLATEGRVMACGHLWDICSKRIGPGVYRVWLERAKL